ncbi:MAG: LysR family transcriptional regulator [Phycisphaerae bacterium]
MNVKVIKTFCDLVESGSFSEAAKLNNVSQSAVSQQVAALESELSTQLLCRGGANALPTEAGEAFYKGGKEIAGRFERMLIEMRAADDAERGVLRIGTIYSVGFYILDELIREFLTAHPEIDLHVEYTHWNHINAAVLRGEMDLGVVAYPQRHRSLDIIPMTDEQLVFVCAPEHELAESEQIQPAQLAGCRFVAFQPNIPTRKHIDKIIRASKVKLEIALEFDNVETLKRAVEVNAGVSILPETTVRDEVEDGYLKSIPISRPERWIRKLGIIRRKGKEPGEAENEFFQLIRQSDKTTLRSD